MCYQCLHSPTTTTSYIPLTSFDGISTLQPINSNTISLSHSMFLAFSCSSLSLDDSINLPNKIPCGWVDKKYNYFSQFCRLEIPRLWCWQCGCQWGPFFPFAHGYHLATSSWQEEALVSVALTFPQEAWRNIYSPHNGHNDRPKKGFY